MYCRKDHKDVPFFAERVCFTTHEEYGLLFALEVTKIEQDVNKLTQENNMTENATTKVCMDCGRELPIEQFRPNHRSKDGHLGVCYECMNKKIMDTKRKKICDDIFDEDEVDKDESPSMMKEVKGKMNAFVERSVKNLSSATDKELKDELVSRGWMVTCTKTIEL